MSQHPSEFIQHRLDLNLYMTYALYFDYKYGFLLSPPGLNADTDVSTEDLLAYLRQVVPVTEQELDWLKQLWLAEYGVGPREGFLAYFMQVMKTGERHALMESELFPSPMKTGVMPNEPKESLLTTPALQLIVNKAVPLYMESVAMMLQLKEVCLNAHLLTSYMTIRNLDIPAVINVIETDCGPLTPRRDRLAEQLLNFGVEYHVVRVPLAMRNEFSEFTRHCGGGTIRVALGTLYEKELLGLYNGPIFIMEATDDE